MSEPTKPAPLAPSATNQSSRGWPAPGGGAPQAFGERPSAGSCLFGGGPLGWGGGVVAAKGCFPPVVGGSGGDATAPVLRDIFKKKDVELTVLNNMKTVTDTSSEQTCQAHIETPAETGTIAYRITLQGSNFQVRINKVDAAPR